MPAAAGVAIIDASRFLSALVVLAMLTGNSLAAPPDDSEACVCGPIRERLAFWTWSRIAGKPDPESARRLPNAEPVEHRTRDGRVLRGYRLTSLAGDGIDRGFVLVAQGNAMLADQLLATLVELSRSGLTVYIFDYRGYGASEGARRLKAIVGDYRELFAAIGTRQKGLRLLYGISFGGVVLANVIGTGAAFDRAVIDSSPSRVSDLGCPQRFDPVANIPADASRILVVAGANDTVVPPHQTRELRELVSGRGGRVVFRDDLAHPFMDASPSVHRARIERIREFLTGVEAPGPG